MRDPRPRGARSLPLAACVALLAAGAAGGAGTSFGEIELSQENEIRGNARHGYTEYRFRVKNRGSERTVRVTLQLPGETYRRGNMGSLTSITRTVDVAPGAVTSVSLLQPAAPELAGSGLAVYLNGRKQDGLVPVTIASSPTAGYGYGSRRGSRYSPASTGPISEPLLLTSQRVPEKFFQVSVLPVPGGGAFPGDVLPPPGAPPGGPPGVGPVPGAIAPAMGRTAMSGPSAVANPIGSQVDRSIMPVSLWTSHWLAYSRYDGVVVTTEDLDELQRGGAETRAVEQALWQYVETGGVLLVLGGSPGRRKAEEALVPVPAAYGRTPRQEKGLLVYPVAFGRCIVSPDRDSQVWTREQRWGILREAVSATGMAWQGSPTVLDLNRSFPVVDDLGVPVKGLFALMVLFGITMGPVNLVLLSRYKRRIWLLWTVPVLALAFCLAVLGYMVVAEGWQGQSRVAGLTLLDEGERRATTLGRAAYYSPLTPGDGLRFSENTEVQALGQEHSAWNNSCTVNWGGEQHLARGWVSARVPAYFGLRKSETLRRERLNLRREDDGGLSVVNALGADVEQLWLADEKGLLYRAGAIPAGGSARLDRAPGKASPVAPGEAWRQLYANSDWVAASGSAAGDAEKYLGPNTYLAVVTSSPFLEPGLKSASARPTESYILGVMAGPPGKP